MDSLVGVIFLASLPLSLAVPQGNAQTCAPPPGFVDSLPPAVAPVNDLIARTEEIDINRSLPVVLYVLDKPIEQTINKAGSLPGVSGSYMLTKGEFSAPGSRRFNCLSDNSTLVEQVLENVRTEKSFRFRYVVWNYTSEKARPIVYGVGEFLYTDAGTNHTHVKWTYSFSLNRSRFPGYLGWFGNFLFRVNFLDGDFATLMRDVLASTKSDAEKLPNEVPKDQK
jgi:hypothetical protein